MKFKEIPILVYNVINNKINGFDIYFCHLLGKGMSKQDAYNEIVDELYVYYPNYNVRINYFNYIKSFEKRYKNTNKTVKNDAEMIIIPDNISKAATDWHYFDKMFLNTVADGYTKPLAYEIVVGRILEYFPMWEVCKNFESYRKMFERRMNV